MLVAMISIRNTTVVRMTERMPKMNVRIKATRWGLSGLEARRKSETMKVTKVKPVAEKVSIRMILESVFRVE
jgi:hypothetical protein